MVDNTEPRQVVEGCNCGIDGYRLPDGSTCLCVCHLEISGDDKRYPTEDTPEPTDPPAPAAPSVLEVLSTILELIGIDDSEAAWRDATATGWAAVAAARAEPPREEGERCTTTDGHHFYRCDICEAVMDTPLAGLLEVGPLDDIGD